MRRIIILILLAIQLLSGYNIEVVGYGNTKDNALKDAFNNAVSEYVGVIIDAKEITKNGYLIEDKILTFSNGYIDNYKTISSKEQMGLWTIEIKAVVKEQDILKQVKKLNIKAKDIKGSKQRYAKVISQIKTKFDAEDMIIKLIHDFGSPNYDKYVSLKIDKIFIDEDASTRKTVPVIITHSIHFNWNHYNQIVNKFKKLFKGIGGKVTQTEVYKTVKIDKSFYKKNTNSIYLIQKNKSNKLIIELWEFPKSYKVIYPFNAQSINIYHNDDKRIKIFNYQKLHKVFNPKFVFESKEKEKLFPSLDFVFMPQYNNRSYQIFNTLDNLKFTISSRLNGYQKFVLSPPLDFLEKDVVKHTHTIDVKISDIKKLNKIGINYER